MAIADDISTAVNGDIRWQGAAATTYSILEFHRYLGALADDAEGAGDDLLDITSSTPSDRSTDQIVTLNSPYNVDDTLIEHLYDGSITQNAGDDVYSGLEVVGSVVAGTEIMIMQDNEILPAYWGAGINGSGLTIMKVIVKSRSGGADIDGKRITLLGRELNDQYKEFPVTLGLANSTGAISTDDDINNNKSDSTLAGYTSIVNTEGFQEIDVDGTGSAGQEFYSQWDVGSQSLNDVYERTKFISQRSHITDNGTDSGNDFTVDNATILGQGQEFTAKAIDEKLTEMRFKLKTGAGTPAGTLYAELYLSDDVGSGLAEPTGSLLATSEEVLCSRVNATYAETLFRFNDNYTLTGGEKYFAIIRNDDGAAGDYVSVQGDAGTGADDGNRAEDTGTWAATAADDLWFTVKSSPLIHSIAGEQFRGITHEIVYGSESGGPFTEDEVLFWGTAITFDNEQVSTFEVGEYVKFYDEGTTDVIMGGKVLKRTATILTVALEDSTGSILADNDIITGLTSGTTADINATITNDDMDGGEGILLALDDNGAAGDFYIQLISGLAPVDTQPIEGRSSAATAAADTTINPKTVAPEFIGGTTGTNLIGAYGIGPDKNDVGSSDKFTSLDGSLRTPPNNVTWTLTGLVSGEDRVLVGPRTGSSLEKGQWLLSTALTTSGRTAVVVKDGAEDGTPIAGDTPTTGEGAGINPRLRIELDSGIYKRQDYTSWTGSTFTIPSTDYTGTPAAVDNDVFLAYIDILADATSEAFTGVYQGDRNLFVRVRDGGGTPIKTIELSAVFGSASSSLSVTRQSDA